MRSDSVNVQAIFQEKDYLNYRYFHKRAYYLASIAAELQDCQELGLKLSYSYLHDDLLRPILVASPSGGASNVSTII